MLHPTVFRRQKGCQQTDWGHSVRGTSPSRMASTLWKAIVMIEGGVGDMVGGYWTLEMRSWDKGGACNLFPSNRATSKCQLLFWG